MMRARPRKRAGIAGTDSLTGLARVVRETWGIGVACWMAWCPAIHEPRDVFLVFACLSIAFLSAAVVLTIVGGSLLLFG